MFIVAHVTHAAHALLHMHLTAFVVQLFLLPFDSSGGAGGGSAAVGGEAAAAAGGGRRSGVVVGVSSPEAAAQVARGRLSGMC